MTMEMTTIRRVVLLLAVLLLLPTTASRASAGDAQLRQDAAAALQNLYAGSEAARLLRSRAKGILVFPHMIKAGFMIGGQIGDGVLFKGGTAVGYYNSLAGSYGLQIGGQTFGYALFFMSNDALRYLDSSDGWEVGVGPSVVVVDSGMAKSMSSTTLTQDVYAFIFNQKGLMAGIGIQGSKITRIDD